MSFLDEVISFCRNITPFSIIATALTIIITTIVIGVKYIQQPASDKDENRRQTKSSAPTSAPTTAKLRNVFDVKQSSDHTKKKAWTMSTKEEEEEKPFRSSYYYAHNSASSNGGYKDGLRAEDYVMNGPRLLSRDGVPVGVADDGDGDKNNDKDISSNEAPVAPSMTTKDNVTSSTAQPTALVPTRKANEDSIPINRYLWDDDGNTDGIAKIYIDSIPGGTSTLNSSSITTKWADASLTKSDVIAKLLGLKKNGLMVQIRRQGGDSSRYHLHVPKMYGEAQEVKIIVRPKKLIVKVYKKKKSKVWPELISKSVVAGGKSLDYVNEDLFRSME